MNNLEERIAYYTDFLFSSYKELFKIQEKLALLRAKNKIPDLIILSEHYPLISFGSANNHNRFSKLFLDNVKENYNDINQENILGYLENLNIDFSQDSRGGGATYIGPGQLLTYPIVDFYKIVNTEFGVDKYKELIDKIMYEVLKEKFNLDVKMVEVKQILNDDGLRKNRMDVWINKNNRNYKIGGKGIHTTRNIAYNGFSIYIKPYSIEGFKYIDACGYDKDELDVTCIEYELKKEINIDKVKEYVLDKMKEKFNYNKLVYVDPLNLKEI